MIKQYTGILLFDFQILRLTGPLKSKYREVEADLLEIGQSVHDFESWYQWWNQKARSYEKQGLLEVAMTYYRSSLFFLSFLDKRKADAYQCFRRCFERFYENADLQYDSVPYEQGVLPAVWLKKAEFSKTLLVIGGFDSYMEELVSWFLPLQEELQCNLLIFDGPGQGFVPAQKLYFQADYEKVVAAVLDYFKLDSVAAIGVSWGGSFVLRAAAFEKRIKLCICFDIFYSAMDALRLQTSAAEYTLLKTGLFLRQRALINAVIAHKAKNNTSLSWMLMHGQGITGEKTAYDFIRNISAHTIDRQLGLIEQSCLLLAGSQDMYVPSYRLEELKNKLVQAKSVQTSLFTEKTGGSLHCQIDNIQRALNAICQFINQHKNEF